MERSRARDHDGRPFATLDRREQVARLRGVARAALDRYALTDARVTLLAHEHHTTFRVQAAGDTYVLRVTRPGVHTPATVASEMAWLQALRADTDLGVPAPVAARDGTLAVLAHAPGMPGPRVCVLLRRPAGRAAGERFGTSRRARSRGSRPGCASTRSRGRRRTGSSARAPTPSRRRRRRPRSRQAS